jgi:MFS family permease
MRLPPCRARTTFGRGVFAESQKTEFTLTPTLAEPVEAVAERGEVKPSAPRALASLSLAVLLSSLGTSIANVGLPTLAQAFAASFQQVQWIVLAYLLAITILIVSAGRLGDLLGRLRLLLGGIFLFTMASALCSVAPTLGLLIAARAAQGLGAAVMMALALAFVADTVPKARTGSAMGLLGTMSAIGTALGPSVGGMLIAGLGWRAIFLVKVPLRSGVVTSALVSTVMMATLVVGPFYLERALGLDAALVGLVLSVGPLVAALTGAPAGRLVDRAGARPVSIIGLIGMAAGSVLLSTLPADFGIPGYVAPSRSSRPVMRCSRRPTTPPSWPM